MMPDCTFQDLLAETHELRAMLADIERKEIWWPGFLDTLLRHVLLERSIEPCIATIRSARAEPRRESALQEHRRLVDLAAASLLLGEPAGDLIERADATMHAALHTVEDVPEGAGYVHERGIALALWSNDQDRAARHRESRLRIPPVLFEEQLGLEILHLAGQANPTLPDKTLLGFLAYFAAGESTGMSIGAWLLMVAQLADEAGVALCQTLIDGVRELDRQLFPDARDDLAVAIAGEPAWTVARRRSRPATLELRLPLSGSGTLHALGPLLEPVVHGLPSRLASLIEHDLPRTDIGRARSWTEIDGILANPEASLEVLVELGDGLGVDGEALRPFEDRFTTAIEWIRCSYASFLCRASLAVVGTAPGSGA